MGDNKTTLIKRRVTNQLVRT
jgi:hypothetical protein